MHQHQLTQGDVDRVLIRAPAAHLRNLMHENPQTPAEAKFSLEYSLAAALHSSDISLADYASDALRRPHVRALMPRITKEYVEKLESEFPTEVRLFLRGGECVETAIAMPVGSKDHPMSDAHLWQKLENCLAAAPSFTGTEQLLTELEKLDPHKPIRQLTLALQSSQAP